MLEQLAMNEKYNITLLLLAMEREVGYFSNDASIVTNSRMRLKAI